MRAASIILGACLILTTPKAAAQPLDAMSGLRLAVETIERSDLQQIGPQLLAAYAGFAPTPLRLSEDFTPEDVAQVTSHAMRADIPRLRVHAVARCDEVLPRVTVPYTRYLRRRHLALAARLAERRGDIARAMNTPALSAGFPGLTVLETCESRAEAGSSGITVSLDMVLVAGLSAIYANSLVVVASDRALADYGAMLQTGRGSFDEQEGQVLLRRTRRTVAWLRALFSMRDLAGLATTPMPVFEEQVMAGMRGRKPECAEITTLCRLSNAVPLALLQARDFDLMFAEQIDFILAHEMGHVALGHAKLARGTCVVERDLELAADKFAVALMRPSTGLFARASLRGSTAVARRYFDGRFIGGLDLLMLESHKLAGFSDGDSCAYPKFDERLAALRAFEAEGFGQAASGR